MAIASMIFFPTREFSVQPKDFSLVQEDVVCKASDGTEIHGWYFDGKGEKAERKELCLLFFHGNADNISIRLPKAKEWIDRGISVLLVDYRGYGKSKGKVERGEDLTEDAKAALIWLQQKKNYKASQIILYGESIGAVPVIDLAIREKFKAVVLEAPFTSIKELAKKYYGMAPDFMIKDFLMDNDSKISQLKSPLFMLHGTDDEVVPFDMGKQLFKKAPEPKELFAINGARHNDVVTVSGKDFYEKPFQFIMDLKDQPALKSDRLEDR